MASQLLLANSCSPLTPDLQEGKVFTQMPENPEKAAEAAREKRGLFQHPRGQATDPSRLL